MRHTPGSRSPFAQPPQSESIRFCVQIITLTASHLYVMCHFRSASVTFCWSLTMRRRLGTHEFRNGDSKRQHNHKGFSPCLGELSLILENMPVPCESWHFAHNFAIFLRYVYVCPPVSLSVRPSLSSSVYPSVCLFVHLPVYLSVRLSLCPSVCPSVCTFKAEIER